jgi:hypothetical protein
MIIDNKTVALQGLGSVVVFRDAALPTLFYYASTVPAVARVRGVDQLTLVHYDKPSGGYAGMLSIVVTLRPDDATLAELTLQLQAQSQLRYPGQDIQLVPIPWTAGTVATALIGGSPVFSIPSLLGDNQAVLSLPLTVDQYLLLRKPKPTAAPPLSVVYGLSYEAFRPEYNFSIEFDATKFRDWLQKNCSANVIFLSVEKVDTYEKLQTSGVIRVSQENLTGETASAGFREAFIESLQSILVPLPAFAPAPEASGGGNWLLGFGCSTIHDVQTITRRLDTNMRISGVVARKAFIQGALAGFTQALAARPDVELTTGTSFKQPLTFRCHGDFDGHVLDAVEVSITAAGNNRVNHLFKESADEWLYDLVREPGDTTLYTYQCTVYFKDRSDTCTSPELPIRPDQAYIDILPSTFYTQRLYTITTDKSFPWCLVKSVTVTLTGPSSFSFRPATATLTDKFTTASIDAFAPSPADLDALTYTATCTPNSSAPVTLDGLPSGPTIYLNPFTRRAIIFRVGDSFDWTAFTQVTVIIDTTPDNPQLYEKARLSLTASSPTSPFVYWFTESRKITYRAIFRTSSGSTQSTSASTVQADVVLALPALKENS